MKSLKELGWKSAQYAVQAPLRKLGFRFELRRRGDLGMALWRLKLSSKKTIAPKRLVFIPGFGDSPLAWLPVFTLLFPKLKSTYDELIFLDFPGFSGMYFNQTAFADIDSMFDHAFEILDQLKAETIVGHSLGAWIASTYSVRVAEGKRARGAQAPTKLILASPPGTMKDEACEEKWKGRFDLALQGNYDDFVNNMFAKAPWMLKKGAKYMKLFFEKPEIRSFMSSIRREHLFASELEVLPAKTYLIWGQEDQLNFYSWSEEWIKRGPPTLQLLTLPGVGHMLHVETPFRMAYFLGQILGDEGLKLTTKEDSTFSRFVKNQIAHVKVGEPKEPAKSA